MNKPIRYLAVACLVMFLALVINVNYVQFVEAGELNDKAGNRRVIDEEYSRDRGPILVAGDPVAESVESDDRYEYQRRYPEAGLYAHLTGYFSYIYGQSAVERSQNRVLSGSDNRLFVNRVVDLLSNKQPKGGSVELTIDPLAQKTAAEGLEALGKDTKGAVVALDPQTGEVLAMVSQPSYDPNRLAGHDFDQVSEAWDELTGDEDEPLLNRATQQILPPGSTFKLVTAAAALENGVVDDIDDKVKAGRTLSFPGIDYQLVNENGSSCGGNEITFEQALNVSCNVAFGGLAGDIGQAKLAEQAAKFGFGTDPLDGIAGSASQFTSEGTDLEAPQLAQSGIGQFEVATTPLQMAMVAAGIANDGDVMKPYLVKTVRSPSLSVLEQAEPERLDQAMSESNARKLQQMMISTVTRGTATSAQIAGVDVGAKTGTAQSAPDRPPYAWFVSFAPADDPQVAVAVIVESTDVARDEVAGGRLAGPIARSVMEAVLGK
jgi:peptidoglycan glycosyltransferase